MTIRRNSPVAAALALGVMLSGCASTGAGEPNRTLYSTAQPVVERQNLTIDVAAGASGLSVPEQQRLAGWFETMNVSYGDSVAIDGLSASAATREQIATIAGRYGLLLSTEAPVTEGFVNPGTVRVVVSRTRAYVPDCPNWTEGSSSENTTRGFGCAINSNFAAMIANPEHLLRGAEGTGETVVMSSTKAIDAYREQKPTGADGLQQVSTQQGGN